VLRLGFLTLPLNKLIDTPLAGVGVVNLKDGILRWKYKEWRQPEYIVIGTIALTKWLWCVQYPENLILGRFTDIGAFTYINAKWGVEIQDFAQIGSFTSIYSESSIDGRKGKVIISRNARIGSHSVIMPGVTIGENAVIGAFSFVNQDVPPNVVAAGVPLKIIRELTPQEIEEVREAIREVTRHESKQQ